MTNLIRLLLFFFILSLSIKHIKYYGFICCRAPYIELFIGVLLSSWKHFDKEKQKNASRFSIRLPQKWIFEIGRTKTFVHFQMTDRPSFKNRKILISQFLSLNALNSTLITQQPRKRKMSRVHEVHLRPNSTELLVENPKPEIFPISIKKFLSRQLVPTSRTVCASSLSFHLRNSLSAHDPTPDPTFWSLNLI